MAAKMLELLKFAQLLRFKSGLIIVVAFVLHVIIQKLGDAKTISIYVNTNFLFRTAALIASSWLIIEFLIFIKKIAFKCYNAYQARKNARSERKRIDRARADKISLISSNLSHREVNVLRIFFEKNIPFGVSGTVAIPSELCLALNQLLDSGFIDKAGSDTYLLPEDTKNRLLIDKHFEKCYRTEVILDPSLMLVGGISRGPIVNGQYRGYIS
ncbi:hypothetical protein WMQ48_18720 [Vibrio cidicii]|uniref:hypothetical protein n=1 Tax=Vibrio cidicii TaxID=1763883 RepID=UPI003751BD74|nr:hypothetical protein [Vibrio vulnificus]